MSKFMKKRNELMTKQQAFLDKMKTFDSFIKENEAKRRRALVKYQSEVRLLEYQKSLTQGLENDIGHIRILHEKLLQKVQRNKKYEDFLLKAIESLPPDYIKVSDNILGGLIMRYNTLSSTNESLVTEMMNKSEEGNMHTSSITKLKQSHDNEILQSNYRLSMMYEEHERLKEQLQRAEQTFRLKHGDIRKEEIIEVLDEF